MCVCVGNDHWHTAYTMMEFELQLFILTVQTLFNIYFQVGLAMVVVESAVTSIYICYAEDPSLIQRWDAEFFNQMSEALHQRLQHRSARAREVMGRAHNAIQETF